MTQLYRSTTDRKIAGVCGGIAEYLEMDPTAVRLIFAAVSLFSGVGILAYIAAVIIIPEREDMILRQ